MLIFNETTKKYEPYSNELHERGIVYYVDEYTYEYGYFNKTESITFIPIYYSPNSYETSDEITRKSLLNKFKDVFSNMDGEYHYIDVESSKNSIKLNQYRYLKGIGGFPYNFERNYEAMDNMNLFKNKEVLNSLDHFKLSEYMPYTFGLEYETSMGYIPEEDCFNSGLIPLRDGSISGLEYSTTVLKGDKGINLIKKQLELLDEHTEFNKECSLHVHIGELPVTESFISNLYAVCLGVEEDLMNYLPPYSFYTSKYKQTGKDYCKQLPFFDNFKSLYKWASDGVNYLGNLVQAHPKDIDRKQKWHIKSRYYWVNFVNMLFYKKPKTVEFRFLRPTYNFRIIYMWLWVFNAIIQYAIKKNTEHPYTASSKIYISQLTLVNIIYDVYPKNIADILNDELYKHMLGIKNQITNGDKVGRDIHIMNKIFTGDSPLE